jgi:hypothetical protein
MQSVARLLAAGYELLFSRRQKSRKTKHRLQGPSHSWGFIFWESRGALCQNANLFPILVSLSSLKMERAYSSESSVTLYHIVLRQVSQDNTVVCIHIAKQRQRNKQYMSTTTVVKQRSVNSNSGTVFSGRYVPRCYMQDDLFEKRSLVKSPRLGSTPRLTDWLTVSCNVTLTLDNLLYKAWTDWGLYILYIVFYCIPCKCF